MRTPPSQILLQALIAANTIVACHASAQVVRSEVHPIATVTLTVPQLLSGKRDGKQDIIAAELRIPKRGSDRLPAVVLMHGAGGITEQIYEWSDQLNADGVATLILDSFTGRGVATLADALRVPTITRIVDAYHALERLAAHPRIDRNRIAIMGLSHGASAALYTALHRFAQSYGPKDGSRFAAHIAIYPPCITTYRGDEVVIDRPIRIFHGAADDWLPIAACREYVARLRKAGKDAVLHEYADAHHSYDWRYLKEPVRLADVVSFRNCRLEETEQGAIVNRETGQPFSPKDACVERGATIAYHGKAHAQTQKDLRVFIVATLKPLM